MPDSTENPERGDALIAESAHQDNTPDGEVVHYDINGLAISFDRWRKLQSDPLYGLVASTVIDGLELRTAWNGRVVDTDAGEDFDDHGHPLIFETLLHDSRSPTNEVSSRIPALGNRSTPLGRWTSERGAMLGHSTVLRTLAWNRGDTARSLHSPSQPL